MPNGRDKDEQRPSSVWSYDLPECPAATRAALEILFDIAILPERNRALSSRVIYVGRLIRTDSRTIVHVLGPTSVHGGILLISTGPKSGRFEHNAYFLEDIVDSFRTRPRCKLTPEVRELVKAAVTKRNRALAGTTLYLSGITGKVIKIL